MVEESNLIAKRITIPAELLKKVDDAIKEATFPGIRSLSGFCEKALNHLFNPGPSPEEAKERFIVLRRVFILYKTGQYSDSEVLHFIAGWCHFAPQGDEEEKLLYA